MRLLNDFFLPLPVTPVLKSVVELVRTHFGDKSSAPEPPLIPTFSVPSHEEPRFSCFVESEAAGVSESFCLFKISTFSLCICVFWVLIVYLLYQSAVMISYKMPVGELKTVRDYRDLLAESMFLQALSQRFFKISRRTDPPFFSCSAAADVLVNPLKTYIMTSSCKEKGTIKALESMLLEVFFNPLSNLLPFFLFFLSYYYYYFFYILRFTPIFRSQGYGYMAFLNVKFLLFDPSCWPRLNLRI